MVYLIHFSSRLKHAGHYLGYVNDWWALGRRLDKHLDDQGARLIQVINELGIEWICVRVWFDADRMYERKLKRQKRSPLLCPVCAGKKAWARANDILNGPLDEKVR